MPPSVSTPINVARLRFELRGHPNQEFVQELCSGLDHGFDCRISVLDLPTKECKNLRTAIQNPSDAQELINSEVNKGYLLGPFTYPPFQNFRVSPIGVHERKYSTKKRLIVDLSSPHDDPMYVSINDLIDKDSCSLKYVKIDEAIKVIQLYGSGAILCKVDITDAFKLLPIAKNQWHLFGLKWNHLYYFYTRLAFGCRSSPAIFDQLSVAICWIATHNYGIEVIFHLLDDFLTIDRPCADGDRTMALLSLIFSRLSIPLATHKTAGPSTVLEYLGLILDTNKMEVRLPAEKVYRIKEYISTMLHRKTCQKRELLQLLGHLHYASRLSFLGEVSCLT